MFTIVGNCNHNESVYNLVPRYYERKRFGCNDPPSYVSRYHCQVRKEAKCQKTGLSASMGVPTVDLNCPEAYLKKYTGPIPKPRSRLVSKNDTYQCPCKSCRADRKQEKANTRRAKNCKSEGFNQQYGQCEQSPGTNRQCHASYSDVIPSMFCNQDGVDRPSFACNGPGGVDPSSDQSCQKCCRRLEACRCGERSCRDGSTLKLHRGRKDFIYDNAMTVVRQPAKVPGLTKVDDYRGHRAQGPAECMLDKKNFGRIPSYLHRRKYELCQADMEAKQAARRAAKSNCRELSEEERRLITLGLRKHWDEVFSDFQRLPLCTATAGLTRRKSELEASLKVIDHDIKMFTRTGPLLVADVAKSHYL